MGYSLRGRYCADVAIPRMLEVEIQTSPTKISSKLVCIFTRWRLAEQRGKE